MQRVRVATGIGRIACCLALATLTVSLVTGAGVLLHRGGGVTRAAATNPVSLLGRAPRDHDCVSAPLAVGTGTSLFCGDYSAVVVDGSIQVVSLYGPGDPVIDAYAGSLPVDVAWGMPILDIAEALGEPSRITDMYGPPTLVYTFDGDEPYRSLELQLDEQDELVRINASLRH